MKTIILTFIGCVATLVSFAQTKSEVLEISTSDFNLSDFLHLEANVYTKYINEQVDAEKVLILKVLASNNAVTIIKSPQSAVHREVIDTAVSPYKGRPIKIQLHKDETVDYEIRVVRADTDTTSTTFKYILTFSTNTTYRPNCNFIFLSAIRSVAGIPPSNEFFDLNLKFNYSGNMFTLFSLDLSLSPPAKADSTQLRINEGLATVNVFFHKGKRLASGQLNRALFTGGGAKVFNQRSYLGAHIGSLEIAGPLFSSYLFAGYYRDVYGGYAKVEDEKHAVLFRNNFYSECTLAFDNKKDIAGILSDIRIKLGILCPFTNSSKDIVKPQSKDIQYRLVMEVPIGGIYKFGGSLSEEKPKSAKILGIFKRRG